MGDLLVEDLMMFLGWRDRQIVTGDSLEPHAEW